MFAGDEMTVGIALMHVCEVRFHVVGWEEGDVFYVEGSENVLLAVVV